MAGQCCHESQLPAIAHTFGDGQTKLSFLGVVSKVSGGRLPPHRRSVAGAWRGQSTVEEPFATTSTKEEMAGRGNNGICHHPIHAVGPTVAQSPARRVRPGTIFLPVGRISGDGQTKLSFLGASS